MYVDVCEYKNEIHCWERNEDGDLVHITAPTKDYLYLFIKDNTDRGGFWNLFNEQMRQVNFNSRRDLKAYVEDRDRDDICEADVQPTYRYIMDNYASASPPTLNIGMYDIEIDFDLEDGHGYPTANNPFGEINAISLYNTKKEMYAMFIPAEHREGIEIVDDRDGIPIEIFWCAHERELLLTFADYIEDIDMLLAWNGDAFDLPYIMARSIMKFGRKRAEVMYCRNGIPATSRDYTNLYGEDVTEWQLKGRIHLDMMLLFKKFNPGELKSFALAAVCEEVLGETKIDYEDDLGSLYRENPQRFYEYSLHDARLLKMLNDKTRIIELAIIFATMNVVRYTDVTGAVKPIESGMMKFCRQKGNVVLPSKKENERQTFKGAIVYDTLEGRHEMVMTADLTGLYPHTMISLGLSPETFIMFLSGGYEDYIKVMTKSPENINMMVIATSEKVTIRADELEAIIREEGYTIAANGAIFDGTMGLLAEFTEYGVNLRKEYQAQMKEAFGAGDKETGIRLNGYQGAVKVLNNSIYGATGEPSFRLHDVRLSEAITVTAQVISKWQAQMANNCINHLRENK